MLCADSASISAFVQLSFFQCCAIAVLTNRELTEPELLTSYFAALFSHAVSRNGEERSKRAQDQLWQTTRDFL